MIIKVFTASDGRASGGAQDAPPAESMALLSPAVNHWLATLGSAAAQSQRVADGYPADNPRRIFYVLSASGGPVGQLQVKVGAAAPLKRGGWSKLREKLNRSNDADKLNFAPPEEMSLILAIGSLGTDYYSKAPITLKGPLGAELLKKMLATGRCAWEAPGVTLTAGPERPGELSWELRELGQQAPTLAADPPATCVRLGDSEFWYIDKQNICGPVSVRGAGPAFVAAFLRAPSLQAEEAGVLLSRAATLPPGLPQPKPVPVDIIPAQRPTAVLTFYTVPSHEMHYWQLRSRRSDVHLLKLQFDYNGVLIGVRGNPNVRAEVAGRVKIIERDAAFEKEAVAMLADRGMQPTYDAEVNKYFSDADRAFALARESEAGWKDFATRQVKGLRKLGWRVVFHRSCTLVTVQPDDWFVRVEETTGMDWFDVELGVLVDGQNISILPMLQQALRAVGGNTAALPANLRITLPTGGILEVSRERLELISHLLAELFNAEKVADTGKLRINRLQAAELGAGAATWSWFTNSPRLQKLATRLKTFEGITGLSAPPNLRAQLRAYQLQGLNWLQFLREYELAGILADDMGLGKTVQTLAHLLVEKQAGRLDRPVLVVAPTSLIPNWLQETERFAPDLKILALHGQNRHENFGRLGDHDVVVTSYPLLARDEESLKKQQWHMVILDEAQNIKNHKTLHSLSARALDARHRLCLTGTPMENHLGELWALFDFLMPGFLGSSDEFRRAYRDPIEKRQEPERRAALARRVAPVILRRKKQDVARELPEKNVMVQTVELSGPQRDLYETIRTTMQSRVQDEIASKGMARSHIVILDALLKLRQVCCDPRLLKLPSARAVKESAKLELLMQLVPEMVQEGRRILLFSQFTSMLDIIQEELNSRQIPFVILTGQTTDRATPVKRFQNGEIPLFLISLKAGGSGLNLTAADTVIHYDPWWNPAVENQATDRAHRIGQDKTVFVYKLLTSGTVEEKIQLLQEKKRALVEGLLSEQAEGAAPLAGADLQELFAPLATTNGQGAPDAPRRMAV